MKDYILVENKDFVAVYKPQNTNMAKFSLELKDYLKVEDAYPIYHLEFKVGGILVYALNEKTYKEFHALYKRKQFEMEFLAVTVGVPKNEKGIYKAFIIYDKKMGKFTHIPQLTTGAVQISFEYNTIETADKISLVKMHSGFYLPETIRFGLADLNSSIFGDEIYEGDTLAKNTNLALILTGLRFKGKKEGEYYSFKAYPPETKPWSYFDIESVLKI